MSCDNKHSFYLSWLPAPHREWEAVERNMQHYLHGDGTQHRGAVQLYPAMQLIASEGSRPGSHVTAGVAASWAVQGAGTFG
jgi:Holliday junction resolvase RusA-like endonuclease